MTLVEILKSQGLTDDQINTITGEMKQNKIFTSCEENIDIRYGKLKTDFDNLTSQHAESTKLIEQLKAGTKNSEELQGQITAYEGKMETIKNEYDQKVADLEAKLAAEQLNNAINLALRDAKATDPGYLAYNLREKYRDELVLGEDGKVKGMDDKIAGLKTQFPEFFENSQQQRKIDPQPLPPGDTRKNEPTSLADAIKAQYDGNK